MNESRFLIVGAYGQLDKALRAQYPKATAVDRGNFDLTNWNTVRDYDWSKFDVILNTAAYANVDGAETPEGREAAGDFDLTKIQSTDIQLPDWRSNIREYIQAEQAKQKES